MPTDNDNEGPGLGLGDLNDIFNDDPFSNAGGESPTGNHRLIISDNVPLLVIYWSLFHPVLQPFTILKLDNICLEQDFDKIWRNFVQAPIPARRARERRGTRRVNYLEVIQLLGSFFISFSNKLVWFNYSIRPFCGGGITNQYHVHNIVVVQVWTRSAWRTTWDPPTASCSWIPCFHCCHRTNAKVLLRRISNSKSFM